MKASHQKESICHILCFDLQTIHIVVMYYGGEAQVFMLANGCSFFCSWWWSDSNLHLVNLRTYSIDLMYESQLYFSTPYIVVEYHSRHRLIQSRHEFPIRIHNFTGERKYIRAWNNIHIPISTHKILQGPWPERKRCILEWMY